MNYTLIGEELTRIARENAQQTRLLIMKRLENVDEPVLKKETGGKLAEEMPSWGGNLWKLTRRYEEWLRENLGGGDDPGFPDRIPAFSGDSS